jgi:hypothetical protein
MKKISVSEHFLRSQDKGLLAPLTTGEAGSYASVLMYKSLDQMEASSELKAALANAVADAQQFFPGFTFNQVPYYFLIGRSKAKDSTIEIKDGSGVKKTILILRQITVSDAVTGYDYIELESGKLVYARSEEAVSMVSNSLKSTRNSRLAEVLQISSGTDDLIRAKSALNKNEQILNYQQGDVSNLISSIPMLEKCNRILEKSITRLNNIISYYNNESKKIKEKGAPPVFEEIKSILDREMYNSASDFVKTDSDIIQALVMRYIGKIEEFDAKARSGGFNGISPSTSGKTRHNVKQIVDVVHNILKAIEQEGKTDRSKRGKYNEERTEKIDSPQEFPDTREDQIFQPFPPDINEESFKSNLPSNIKGFQNEGTFGREKDAITKSEEIKLKAMQKMQNAVLVILNILTLKKDKGQLSVKNFSAQDMQALKESLEACMALYNSYKQSILTKQKVNMNTMDSICISLHSKLGFSLCMGKPVLQK